MADQHINRLTNDLSGGVCENEFAIADTWYIDNYTAGDWNGIAGSISKLYSDTPGSQVTINISAIGDFPVSFCDFKDVNIVGGTIDASDGTSVDGGNNDGITFPALAVAGITGEARCWIGAGIGI